MTDIAPGDPLGLYREESLRRLQGGGIPFAAAQRLAALRGPAAGLFTSELSVEAFGLTRHAQLRPVSQVMGSGVFDVATGLGPDDDRRNQARVAALHRMWLEGRECGAHLVAGITLRENTVAESSSTQFLEFTATGTALAWTSRPGASAQDAGEAAPRAGEPTLTSLSVQDCLQLLRHGYRPLALVAATRILGVHRDDTVLPGREDTQAARVVKLLYHSAMEAVRAEAAGLKAAGIVGLAVRREMLRRPGLTPAAAVHVIGTAIARVRGGDPAGPASPVPVLPLGGRV